MCGCVPVKVGCLLLVILSLCGITNADGTDGPATGMLRLMRVTISVDVRGHGWAVAESEAAGPLLLQEFLSENPSRDLNVFASYGFTGLQTEVLLTNMPVSVISRGRYRDPMDIIRLVDSSVRFDLTKTSSCRVTWNAEELEISARWRENEPLDIDEDVEFVFLTEGRFLDSSDGLLSVNRDSVTLSLREISEAGGFSLSLTAVAAKEQGQSERVATRPIGVSPQESTIALPTTQTNTPTD